MDRLLLERSLGRLGPNEFARIQTTSLLRSFPAAPRLRLDGGERAATTSGSTATTTAPEPATGNTSAGSHVNGQDSDASSVSIWAHQAGVSALALERFDSRILISGGSDATIKLWDLEQGPHHQSPQTHTYRPVAVVARTASSNPPGPGLNPNPGPGSAAGHRFGITHLSFYPFDSAAFLSSSHDQTLKLWSTERASISGTFDLGARVYTHAASPIASHLLVACGTQHPAVRLVDLRSASAVQSLVSPGQLGRGSGSAGAALAVAWSPAHAHVLASGSADGAVRVWDVRNSNGLVAMLDQEDVTGVILPYANTNTSSSSSSSQRVAATVPIIRPTAKAHSGPVNALAWADDGAYLASAGHDAQISVWDAGTGANSLASFGPVVRINSGYSSNGQATFVCRGAGGGGASSGVVMGGSNAPGGVFSGHSDRQIRAWIPRLEGVDDEDESAMEAERARSMKRKALDDAYRSLMGRQITFS
ncbi:WD40 repeat-like protein [Parathielavia hyrcaniae]|uniref:WD40 repeat-like protein n=1 Tax=Parathielavia hyrcaniae TaxID=113614 RepID=A0AAN6T422_9PEZI|nr:WD40 repeat-like protein [Parathielavia hyrcaniae]